MPKWCRLAVERPDEAIARWKRSDLKGAKYRPTAIVVIIARVVGCWKLCTISAHSKTIIDVGVLSPMFAEVCCTCAVDPWYGNSLGRVRRLRRAKCYPCGLVRDLRTIPPSPVKRKSFSSQQSVSPSETRADWKHCLKLTGIDAEGPVHVVRLAETIERLIGTLSKIPEHS